MPNSKQQVFEVASKPVKAHDSLFLDITSLSKWGEFLLPEHIWLAMSRFACWIEPVIVNEWSNTMRSYQGNNVDDVHRKIPDVLQWLEPKRTTVNVRKRFDELTT